ncbi:MAG TPA: lipid-binding SYLF domain-containing protein [Bryobacteraceae bacterium]|nr:lipid-binding SYLF domain-containing protein [Bryobacteraceae bacterium]
MKGIVLVASLLVSTTALFAGTAQDRLKESADVLSEVMSTPDKGIPQDLLSKAECVVIIPGLKKAAFVVGGEYGRGFAECRRTSGTGWGAPAAVRMEGGSYGFQIGGSSTDLVLLIMNQNGMKKLLDSKFTLGADASVAAGPVGRSADAKTDAYMSAEILAWSRTKGLFAGIALNGATLRNDLDENAELYGSKLTNKQVIEGSTKVPAAAEPLIHVLDRYSARGTADRSVK